MMSCSSRPRKIASNLLLSGGRFWRDPIVEVAADGEILSISTSEDRRCGGGVDSSAMTEFYSGVMVAGFVNAHSHLELAYLRGTIESGGGFAAFASAIGAVRDKFSHEERLRAIERAEAEMVREGVVAVGDIMNGETVFEAKLSGGVEYQRFAELFGLRSVDMSAIDPLLRHDGVVATPHSLYSLNDPIFREIVRRADRGRVLSIHLLESESEQQLYRRRGSLYDWYSRVGFECDFLDYGSAAERLVALVPRDQSVMLVHNCCITQRDIDLILSHFTAPVFFVVCPRSNRYISNAEPPVELLRANGARVCVGTDSLASNWSLSMLDELREMESVPLVERLDWATRMGAEALGFSHLGDIEVGRRPHINILSGLDYEAMQLTSNSKIQRLL